MIKKHSARLLALLVLSLAGYQVVRGIEGLDALSITAATIAFGVLVVASLLILILGPELLGSPWVATVSSIIPLSLAAGMVHHYMPRFQTAYLIFAALGLAAIIITRFFVPSKVGQTVILAFVHAIAGGLIILIPVLLVLEKRASPVILSVSIGGALMGLVGVLLGRQYTRRLKLNNSAVYTIVMGILTLATFFFVLGSRVSH